MKISDLSQKIHPFGRKGMFAYAGTEFVARSIVRGISERLERGEEMSEEFILGELNGLNEAERSSVSFAVIYGIDDHHRFRYFHDMQVFKSKVFGDVYFCGSGDNNLTDLL
ncbi:hypothetical protein SAMN05444168_1558 [Paraburkholderia phenazinium]|uniref:Uncharacterized protein n=2 Tax=Paraburkholderia phenazinium TaxID=60549 RepID=A0A1N6FGU4_9BURK|nr:hypothetical protein SAMN05444168_1558 [Paraburkholderia phenazinium]